MSVVDREALKADIDWLEVYAPELEPYDDVALRVAAAARSVLEGEATKWCEVHNASSGGPFGQGHDGAKECDLYLFTETYPDDPCSMVRVVVVPIKEK